MNDINDFRSSVVHQPANNREYLRLEIPIKKARHVRKTAGSQIDSLLNSEELTIA